MSRLDAYEALARNLQDCKSKLDRGGPPREVLEDLMWNLIHWCKRMEGVEGDEVRATLDERPTRVEEW